ncbi:hypothetical protein [Nocardia sp. NPDC050406]|uniref:hypothetical protein n=1 Tax=Nocardia sp. NPDC050406 TaxID=3364318 RepID=UPI0037B012FA
MTDHDPRAAHGPREENLAEFVDELRLLAEAVLERVEPVLRKTAADGRTEWSSCSWCPVCAAAALLRGEHHDVVAAIAEHGTSIVTVLREALAGVPVDPLIPPELDPDSPEYAAAHQRSHHHPAPPGDDATTGDEPATTGADTTTADHPANPQAPAPDSSPTTPPPSGKTSFWSNVATNLRSSSRDSGHPPTGSGADQAPQARAGGPEPFGGTGPTPSRANWFTSGADPTVGRGPGQPGDAAGHNRSFGQEGPTSAGAAGQPGSVMGRGTFGERGGAPTGEAGRSGVAGPSAGAYERSAQPSDSTGSVRPQGGAGRGDRAAGHGVGAAGTGRGAPPEAAGRGGLGRGAPGTGRASGARGGYVPISVTIKPPTT